jgi:hypothetical protein
LPETQDEITVLLSGVRSPVYKFNDIVGSEPFSLEAKIFTEYKLWNRTVSVVLDGLDKFNFFATVTWSDKKLNIAKDLLEMGLANFVEWSMANKQDVQAWKEVRISSPPTVCPSRCPSRKRQQPKITFLVAATPRTQNQFFSPHLT